MKINWDKVDEFLASFQRPYATYVCATAVAYACIVPATAPIAIPIAGAVIGGNIAARTVERVKTTSTDADVRKTEINANQPNATMVTPTTTVVSPPGS
jgi:hypothetical protein